MDRRNQLIAAAILEQKSARPGGVAPGGETLRRRSTRRPASRAPVGQDSGDRHAVHPCGPRIEQDYSLPESNGEFDRRFLIGCHSDNFNVVSGLEQANEGVANLGIAIDNQHANGFMRSEFQCVIPSKAENNAAPARSVQAAERRLSAGGVVPTFHSRLPQLQSSGEGGRGSHRRDTVARFHLYAHQSYPRPTAVVK